MIKLYGFPISNYFNKVRTALLEKGVEFELNPHQFPSQDPDFLQRSPMGKIPVLETENGGIVESTIIAEYLEDRFPGTPLLPKDPYERAKVRELLQTLELHVELVARRLYGSVLFGMPITEETKQDVAAQLEKGVAALKKLVKFSPYIAGSEFTIADCAAAFHLPLVSKMTKIVLGKDALADIPGIAEYLKLVHERPHVKAVEAEREQALSAMMAQRAAKPSS